jgi:hypothetical protein
MTGLSTPKNAKAMAKGGAVHRLRRNLAELLDPTERSQPTRRTSRTGEQRTVSAEAQFMDRLKAILDRPGELGPLAGRVNVVGLDKVKAYLGASWERMAERAERIARKVIERHLDQGDIYGSTGNDTYVMVFARLSPEQAQVKCLLIADEIAKTLLGEQGGDLLNVKTAATRIVGKLDAGGISPIDQIVTSLSNVADLLPMAVPVAAAPAAPPLGGRPSSISADVLGGLRLAYRPMWDSARNVIAAYLCAAQVPTSDVGSALSDAELAVADDANELARLDSTVQQRVMNDLADLIAEKRRLLITLPVHFESLGQGAWRRNYFAEMTRLDAEGRKLLMVEIVGLPQGVLQSRLLDLIAPLRSLCRGVMLRVPLEMIDLTQVRGCVAAAVGCDLTGQSGSEIVLVQQMNRFARAVERTSMPSYVHGAQTLSLVTAALGAGFNYIDGDAVAKLVDHPRHAVEFGLADLYGGTRLPAPTASV